jgi:putative flavoprotein involved in K+ transport
MAMRALIFDRGRVDTVIVGAGQAGLATGYCLAARGRDFVIIDGHERVGDAWRQRWDSLRLFTPAAYDGLPGIPFPAPPHAYPTKDEMATYLEAYAARFALPLILRTVVTRLVRPETRYVLSADNWCIEADHVVVATGGFHRPRVPAFASALDARILQLHSAQYRGPGQLQDGPVLIVGAGNSGAEIALDVAARHTTWLSGRDTGRLPLVLRGRGLRGRLFWWLASHVLTVDRRIGRAVKRREFTHGAPLIRVRHEDFEAAGIRRVPRTIGARDGAPVLEDGSVAEVANIIWCTGFRADFAWIDLPVFGSDGYPVHYRGVVEGAPGLCFVGLPFLYSLGSSTVGGVGRDAEYIARYIAGPRQPRPARAPGWPSEPALSSHRPRMPAAAFDTVNEVRS